MDGTAGVSGYVVAAVDEVDGEADNDVFLAICDLNKLLSSPAACSHLHGSEELGDRWIQHLSLAVYSSTAHRSILQYITHKRGAILILSKASKNTLRMRLSQESNYPA